MLFVIWFKQLQMLARHHSRKRNDRRRTLKNGYTDIRKGYWTTYGYTKMDIWTIGLAEHDISKCPNPQRWLQHWSWKSFFKHKLAVSVILKPPPTLRDFSKSKVYDGKCDREKCFLCTTLSGGCSQQGVIYEMKCSARNAGILRARNAGDDLWKKGLRSTTQIHVIAIRDVYLAPVLSERSTEISG